MEDSRGLGLRVRAVDLCSAYCVWSYRAIMAKDPGNILPAVI